MYFVRKENMKQIFVLSGDPSPTLQRKPSSLWN